MTVLPQHKEFNNPLPLSQDVFPNNSTVLNEVHDNVQAVVMIVREADLRDLENGEYQVLGKPLYQRRTRLEGSWAEDFPYRNAHSSYAIGTGCFVRKNLVLTAAHLLFSPRENLVWKDLRFIRAYDNAEGSQIVSEHQIYRPVKNSNGPLAYQVSNTATDWALIEVAPMADDPEFNLVPRLCTTPLLKGHPIYAIGHGLGLALKISNTESSVLANDLLRPYFECDLPLLVSSSGSPVFCAISHQLVGIIVRAVEQLQLLNEEISIVEQISRHEGQECQRLAPILPYLHT